MSTLTLRLIKGSPLSWAELDANFSALNADKFEKSGGTITGAVTLSLATGNSLVVDTNVLVVDATNNRVGVGTATPSVKLHISDAANIVARVQTTGGTIANLNLDTPSQRWTLGNQTALIVYDETAAATRMSIAATTGNVAFDTNTLVVDAANNRVGIGTASPASALQINGGTGLPTTVRIVRSGWSGIQRIGAAGSSGGDLWISTNYDPVTGTADTGAEGNSFIGLGENVLRFGTSATERARITSGGNLLFGTTSAATGSPFLDFVGDSSNGRVGFADNTTDATNKIVNLGLRHYTNAEEMFGLIRAQSTAAANTLSLGGGSGVMNAATQVSAYTAANNTTTTGTERLRIDNTAVAGNTALMIYDVDNATLERVTVGAADSGGAGFKLLRIPN